MVEYMKEKVRGDLEISTDLSYGTFNRCPCKTRQSNAAWSLGLFDHELARYLNYHGFM